MTWHPPLSDDTGDTGTAWHAHKAWHAHGDLHGRQIITGDGRSPFGVLDFDDASRAGAPRDLAYLDFRRDRRLRRNSQTPARYLKADTEVLAAAEQLQVSPDRRDACADAHWLRRAGSSLPSRSSLGIHVPGERVKHRQSFGSTAPIASRSLGFRS